MVVLSERYNSEARMRKIVDEIKDLNINQYIPKVKYEGDALQMLACRIENFVPQCPTLNGLRKDMKEALYGRGGLCTLLDHSPDLVKLINSS